MTGDNQTTSWHPISTYPMDGSDVLIFFFDDEEIDVASRNAPPWDAGWWSSYRLDFEFGAADQFITHWMSIPVDDWQPAAAPPPQNHHVLVRGHNAWVVEPAFLRDGVWYRAHHEEGDWTATTQPERGAESRLGGNTDTPEEWRLLPAPPEEILNGKREEG